MKIRRNSRVPFYILLLIPFFELQSLDNMIMIGFQENLWNVILNIFSIARLGVTLLLLGNTILHKRIGKDPVVIGVVLFVLCQNVSSIINGSWFLNYAIGSLSNLGLLLLCKKLASKSQKDFATASELLFSFYSILGALSIILFPYGFFGARDKAFAIYFLGAKNTSVLYWWIFLLILTFQHARDKRFPLWIIGLDLFFSYAAYVADSANSLIVLFLLLLLFLTLRWKSFIYRFFTPKRLVLIVIMGSAVILIPQLRSLLEPVVNAFGRNMDFTGRTVLWEQAILDFTKKPLFGNGIFMDFILINRAVVDHAHCFYLDLLAKYGIIAFMAFILEIVLFFYQFVKRSMKDRRIIAIGSYFVFVMLVHSIMENLPMYQWIFCLGFLSYANTEDCIIKERKNIRYIIPARI